MKKITIILMAIVTLIVASALIYADVNIHQLRTVPNQTAADILPATERDCTPNSNSTTTDQAEIIATAKTMAQFNDEKNNTTNSQLTLLTQRYNQEIAKYDNCVVNAN